MSPRRRSAEAVGITLAIPLRRNRSAVELCIGSHALLIGAGICPAASSTKDHSHPSGVTVEFIQRRRMIGNLLNMRERFVSAPDVTGLNIGDDRVGAGIAVSVERAGAQQGVDIRARYWACRFGRIGAGYIVAAALEIASGSNAITAGDFACSHQIQSLIPVP